MKSSSFPAQSSNFPCIFCLIFGIVVDETGSITTAFTTNLRRLAGFGSAGHLRDEGGRALVRDRAIS
jgi:hypothetical protein